ncbi:MAG: glycosyltransferase family 4 protein [Candidatus Acidiferrales bacterium]
MTENGQINTSRTTDVRQASCSSLPTRILVLTTIFPYPPTNGIQIRTWQTLLSLAEFGCEIHLVSFDQSADPIIHAPDLPHVCHTVEVISQSWRNSSQSQDYGKRLQALFSERPYSVARFRSAAMRASIDRWLNSNAVDVIISDTIYPLVNMPAECPVPVIVNCHNAEHLILQRYLKYERSLVRRAYAWMECQKLESFEEKFCSRASLLLACSEYDKAVMQKLCPAVPVSVVPNTVDIDRYAASADGDGRTVLYTGGMDWFPNRDAVDFFVKAILPELRSGYPNAKFVVAGRPGPKEFHRGLAGIPNVEFRGPVADMAAEIAAAAVCIVPLRIGSGTRLKILEAGAAGKPIVSTRVGAEGLNFREGTEILLADEPREFAAALNSLLRNPDRRRSMGQAARRKVEEQYSYRCMKQSLAQALKSIGTLKHDFRAH